MAYDKLLDAVYDGGSQRNRLLKLDTSLGEDWLFPLYVKGTSRIGRDYEFVVDAFSYRGDRIDLNALVGKAITLWIQQADGSYQPHHGYVHGASRLGSDGYLTFYQLRFSSWMYFLHLRRDMRDWQEATGEQIIADVFNEHPQARGAYRFDLRQSMPSYSYRVQWEYDWNFVHRSLEETGVFGRIEQAEDGKSHKLVLMDDLYFVPQLKPETVKFVRIGVRQEADGLAQWKEQQEIQSATLTTRTFDYKRPDLPKHVTGDVGRNDSVPSQGEVYDYTGAYTWGESDHGDNQAKLRLDEWQSKSKRFHGVGSLRSAMPGYWFTLTGHPVHDKGSSSDREFVILSAAWAMRNNLPGMDEVADFPESLRSEIAGAAAAGRGGVVVKHGDGSEGFFQVEIEAQRRRTPFRSPREHEKPVMQLQSGIVAGPDGEEAFTDHLNRVKVWFPWNRRNGKDESASCWIRAAFPDAGSTRGGHFPMRAGDEVLVGFVQGDCDRPVIMGRMHGGDTPPTWHTNALLSGFRSKEYGGGGYNQLVMDDSTGQNRIHLYSTSADSHLHLGYLVDHSDNTRGAYLGSGFDLKSTDYGAIRAGQGLYVSTHPTTASQPLDVGHAASQLSNAESVMEAVSGAGIQNRAEGLKLGRDALRAFTDTTQFAIAGDLLDGRTAGGGTGGANGFADPILLLASPAGVGVSTQQSTHIAADQHVNLVSGQNTYLATGKSLVASVVEKVSVFAQQAGMKLFAGKGKVEIEAQSDEMALTALRDLTVTSSDGRLMLAADKDVKLVSTDGQMTVSSKQGITITSGGAYIKIANGNIELGCPGEITMKSASFQIVGPAQLPATEQPWPGQIPKPYSARVAVDKQIHEWIAGQASSVPYQYIDSAGKVISSGVLDDHGMTERVFHKSTEALTVLLGSKGPWEKAEHLLEDCGCGFDHSDAPSPGFSDLVDSAAGKAGSSEEGDGKPLQSALGAGASASPSSSDAVRKALLEQLVFSHPDIKQAILDGEE
ncbi:type VI secretion system Vgr family protein [Trinickia fusca]|uniref:Type VI secretion system tip protein VgrG n=1 Tax=Trinickia fusca TaxID=2419777 RepID=A0A494X6B4_9BURK|nr:type VI secretion system Vgr family protein [Trinickia fusca]RKP45181.1 type VI secretion system tip protein VgrG [Trinickia fusca]